MPAAPTTRRRVELVFVPIMAALCMAFIIGAIVLDKDPAACPAATWANTLKVTLTGSQSAVAGAANITACAGSTCIPLNPMFAKNAPNATDILAREANGSWVFVMGEQPPSAVTLRVFDTAGNLLTQESRTLNWTRVGGTEQCGGPMAAMRVQVQVP
ncbi:hypothetical protein [Arthrobacter cryoconiti]|uniref:Secreted protein n=1 Tax=Arthrobacter cryoconiti TaxID=748907 RepID=A0ABV8R202_9MICC|nr:hypothetical protein [Arthrobacter cryoconiti]MCC9067916.1 hypothetical protein [Arthrobacter cryoconiti]